MIRYAQRLLLPLLSLPLTAQAWDARLEGVRTLGAAEQGTGLILTGAHRIVRVNPVLKLEWCAEATGWKADPTQVSPGQHELRGLGLGLNAQFWVPFTGLAGETALIQRFQEFRQAGHSPATHSRTWFRAGLRYRLPLPTPGLYLATSWQACLVPPKESPMDHLWSVGIGFSF